MLGFFLATISSASFGLNNAAVRRGVLSGTAFQALYTTVIMGVPLFIIASLISGEFFKAAQLSLNGYSLLAAAGVVHFYFGRYCNYRSIAALGANRSAPIRNMSIPISVAIAFFFLKEALTPWMLTGIFLIMIGPAIIYESPGSDKKNRPDSFKAKEVVGASEPTLQDALMLPDTKKKKTKLTSEPPELLLRQTEGYLFGILSAIAYGLSPILINLGLQGISLPIFGGLISYAAASLVLIATLFLPGKLSTLQSIKMKAGKWFLFATVAVFFAQMFRYLALAIAPVTIVAPLQRVSGIFALGFAYLINKQSESFNPRVIIGIALAIIGSVLLLF